MAFDAVIEKLRLFAVGDGINLQLSDSLDANRVTNPGNTGSNHLLPTHLETIHLSFAKPDGMGFMPATSPGQSNWPGFFNFGPIGMVCCPLSWQWLKNSENTRLLIFKAERNWPSQALFRNSFLKPDFAFSGF